MRKSKNIVAASATQEAFASLSLVQGTKQTDDIHPDPGVTPAAQLSLVWSHTFNDLYLTFGEVPEIIVLGSCEIAPAKDGSARAFLHLDQVQYATVWGNLEIVSRLIDTWFSFSKNHGIVWKFSGVKIGDIADEYRKEQTNGGIIYSDRSNKSENAPAFLKRVYADELAAGELTLSILRNRDKSLWAGLRNWASAGRHDLDAIIPRGRTNPGPPPNRDIDFDPASLNPNDPRDALALRALKQREHNRQSMQRKRLAAKPR